MTKQKSWKAYLAWFSLNLFFMYIYALRVSSGVMFGELRQEFCMTGEQFGIFAACYLYSYSLVQVPLGVLLDKIGIRKVALGSALIVFCSLGLLINSHNLYFAYLSRILLGLGSASVLMSGLKFAADQLPSKLRGVFMGLTLSTGTVGALAAGHIIPEYLKLYNWRDVLYLGFYGGIPILTLMYIFLPHERQSERKPEDHMSWSQVGSVVWAATKNWHIILYGILSIGVYTPLAVIADSWGTAFLTEKYGWLADKSARTIMNMYIGLSIGSILLPWISRLWGDYNQVIKFSLWGLLAGFSIVIYAPQLPEWQLMTILIAIGILCGSEMMCFSGASYYTTPKTSGITLGVVNTFNMLGGAFINHAIGKVLDLTWVIGNMENDLRIYTVDNYVAGLSVLIAVIGICIVFSIKLGRPKKEEMVVLPS